MIRPLLLTCFLLGLVRGEEPRIAEFLPDLSAPEFKTRQAAMEKIQAFAKKNPESFLKEIPPLLKKTKDPEIRLRLREVALGLKFKTTKSLFGFTFLLNRACKFENQIVCRSRADRCRGWPPGQTRWPQGTRHHPRSQRETICQKSPRRRNPEDLRLTSPRKKGGSRGATPRRNHRYRGQPDGGCSRSGH